MKALSFNNWNRINEAVIGWEDQEGLKEFYEDSLELLTVYGRTGSPALSIDDLKTIGEDNGVEVVTYDEFLEELPEEAKHTAPPRQAGLFALVNPETGGPRVVISIPRIDKRALDHIFHMLKHEAIHIGQYSRRPDDVETPINDPKDQGTYFSDKDEVMAFSHSIADMLISSGRYDDAEEAMKNLGTIRLYNTINKTVSEKILKRYHKYIYAYLQKEIQQ